MHFKIVSLVLASILPSTPILSPLHPPLERTRRNALIYVASNHGIPEIWWLKTFDNYSPTDIQVVKKKIDYIVSAINKYADFDENAAVIAKAATESEWAVFMSDGKIGCVKPGFKPTIILMPQDFGEILFEQRGDLYHYEEDGSVICLPALDVPEHWLAANFYYKYGMALAIHNRIGEPSFDREVMKRMVRTLEVNILRRELPLYARKINEIVLRRKDRNYEKIQTTLTMDDFKSLDKLIFGRVPSASLSMTSVMVNVDAIELTIREMNSNAEAAAAP